MKRGKDSLIFFLASHKKKLLGDDNVMEFT